MKEIKYKNEDVRAKFVTTMILIRKTEQKKKRQTHMATNYVYNRLTRKRLMSNDFNFYSKDNQKQISFDIFVNFTNS